MKIRILTLLFSFAICLSACSEDDSIEPNNITSQSSNEYQCEKGSPNIVGAICNDGSRSDATGQGACSSHGGVDYWICR
jgi:hypothetical protein